jgi:hypothetical protein
MDQMVPNAGKVRKGIMPKAQLLVPVVVLAQLLVRAVVLT